MSFGATGRGGSGSSGDMADVVGIDFTKCLEATNGDMAGCGYYLEALSTLLLDLRGMGS